MINKELTDRSFRLLTWNRVLIVILKPSEKSIHSREDLAPVAESLWCHCHILYPGRSRETMRHHRLFQSLTDRSHSEQAWTKTTGSAVLIMNR